MPAPSPFRAKLVRLYRVEIGRIWSWALNQPASYWFVVLYMFFEYVRPQSIYTPIRGMPFASWMIYLGIASFFLEGQRGRRWNLADSLLALFMLVVLASSITAYRPEAAFREISIIASWVLIYALITLSVNSHARMFVFMLAYVLYCLKMSQHGFRSLALHGFSSWGVTCGPGWFHNSGECGVQMAMFVPLSFFFVIALKKYWSRWKTVVFAFIPFSAVVTILGTSSRGAQLALVVVIAWIAMQYKGRRFKAIAAMMLLIPLGWFVLPDDQKERFSAMGTDVTSESRKAYWSDGLEIMGAHPVLGVGYKNWLPYYGTVYGGGRDSGGWGELPHNIFIEAGAELGYTGMLVFVAMIGATFLLNYRTRKMAPRSRGDPAVTIALARGLDGALVGYMIAGFFVSVLYYPFFWINLAMTVALYSSTQKEIRRNGVRFDQKPVGGRRARSEMRTPVRSIPHTAPRHGRTEPSESSCSFHGRTV